MISDTALLQPLPEQVQRSVDAYVGCLSGAIDKRANIDLVKAAGFQDVQLLKESPVSIDHITNDPAATAIMEEMNLSSEMVERIGEIIASIQFSGRKPK